MNQIAPIRTSNQIYLYSKDANREYGSNTEKNSNLRFYLDQQIHLGFDDYKLEVSLVSFNCPVSWGNVDLYNNKITYNGNTQTIPVGDYNISDLCSTLSTTFSNLTFTFNDITRKTSIFIDSNVYTVGNNETFTINSTSYTIPSGTYTTFSSLQTAVNSVMPTNFSVSNNILGTAFLNMYINGPNTEFTFSSTSQILNYFGFTNFTDGNTYTSTLKVIGSSNYQVIEANLEIENQPQYFSGNIYEKLGFSSTQNIIYKSFQSNDANDITITSNNIFDLSGYPHLVILSNFNTKNISSYTKRPTKILAHIPIENSHYISFHGTGFKFLTNDKDIHYIDIILLDPDHNEIDMRGTHFSLTLQLDYLPI